MTRVIHEDVQTVGVRDEQALEGEIQRRFGYHTMACLPQAMGKAKLVGLFQKAQAKHVLNVIGHAQDGVGELGMGARF